MLVSRRSLLLSSLALPLVHLEAYSQSSSLFPSRAITWVLPYPPGGFGDAVSRVLAHHMSTTLKCPVVVDNRPGAGGQIAAAFVKQQPADGHTLFNGDVGTFAMNAALYPRLNYDTLKDFAPLTRLLTSSLILVVPSSSRLQTFDDLVQTARTARDGKSLMYGSFGIGSQPHIWMELLKREVQGNLQHIPYKGAAPAVKDLIGGHCDVMLDIAANSIPYVRLGQLRALAVVGSETSLEGLPRVPTLAELGYPSLNAPSWNGVVLRAGTPSEIVSRLHSAVQQAVASDEVKRRYSDLGIFPAVQTPSDFGRYLQTEADRWGSAIRRAGVVLE